LCWFAIGLRVFFFSCGVILTSWFNDKFERVT
jgi:hypothetical protein